jgi:3-oxoacyl-[acyl-carrier protein] reductase
MNTPISGPINLEGKSALITGAARGIGRSICVAFAREKAKVAAIDILSLADTEREIRIKHPDAEIYSAKCDISNESEVNSVIQEVMDRYNRIDIFVGNAAVAGTVTPPDKGFMDVPLAEWKEISNINVRGSFICCRAVWPIMPPQKGPSILSPSGSPSAERPRVSG